MHKFLAAAIVLVLFILCCVNYAMYRQTHRPLERKVYETLSPPGGPFSHAVRFGNTLYLSGIGPRDPADNTIPGNVHDEAGNLTGYDIDAQTRAVFRNVRAVLEASGAAWQDLVDVTVYLTDMARDFTTYNAVWAEYFPDAASAP